MVNKWEDPHSVDAIRMTLLQLEKHTREAIPLYDNQYAAAHLEEVNLLVKAALVQLKYAQYADQVWDVRS